jgi:ankyrin repeat protein
MNLHKVKFYRAQFTYKKLSHIIFLFFCCWTLFAPLFAYDKYVGKPIDNQTEYQIKKQTRKLFKAIENNNYKAAKKALQKGAMVNSYNLDEPAQIYTPLSRAVRLEEEKIVELLLQNGANPNQTLPINNFSPLMISAQRDNPVIAKMLLDYGADPNIQSIPFLRTALDIAALRNSIEVAKVLLKHPKTDINNRDGLCPLAIAARQGHFEIVQLLFEARIEKGLSKKCYQSAIKMAELNQHLDILDYLKNTPIN